MVARWLARLAQYRVAHSSEYFQKLDFIWETYLLHYEAVVKPNDGPNINLSSLQLMVSWSHWLLPCWLGLLSTGMTIQVNIFEIKGSCL